MVDDFRCVFLLLLCGHLTTNDYSVLVITSVHCRKFESGAVNRVTCSKSTSCHLFYPPSVIKNDTSMRSCMQGVYWLITLNLTNFSTSVHP